jgi:hypothetical protein
MKGEILEFLRRERDALAEDLRRLRQGERRVVRVNSGDHDATQDTIAEIEIRLHSFEELIAASEAGLA